MGSGRSSVPHGRCCMVASVATTNNASDYQCRWYRIRKLVQGSVEMTGVVSGLAASIGVAIVITSLTLPNRKSKEVIDATARGAVSLVEAALGQYPRSNI